MVRMLTQLIASFLATVAFAVLFHVPKKEFFYCGITG
ncbi:MAG TPA: threonine/serine exporter, partial [Lachnospiraceae bacterium]|nr:threonine/serine exporter [Lachnospiraceae bacterium]